MIYQLLGNFSHALTPADATDIRAYVIESAKTVIGFCESVYREQYPELLQTVCETAHVETEGSAGG